MVKWDGERRQWYSEFMQGGIRIFRRMPRGVTKAQAEEWEVKRRRELFEAGPLGNRPDVTLPAAIGLWLEQHHRKNRKKALSEAKQWEPFVRGKLLKDAPEVAQAAVKSWRHSARAGSTRQASASATGTVPSPATVNRRLALLKAVAKMMWKQGLIQDNISGRITALPENNARHVYLTKQEVALLASHAPSAAAKAAIMVGAYTGMRASEILAIGATSKRATSLAVTSSNSKTGKPRVVPIAGPARPYLSALPLALDYWQLHKQFLVARKAAGMPQVRFHDLRHTCASWLINQDVDLYVVGKILGHSSPQSTARYSHLAEGTMARAMARLK